MDTHKTSPVSLKLKENLQGRIDNLAMAPSYENTLNPLFEAIMNSIHSVQERFGDKWPKKGRIIITVERDEENHPHSFIVEDNGNGLSQENFESFITYDSRYKIKKGGKGVGRLTWLKVFETNSINSVYACEGMLKRRKFDFLLDNKKPIQNYSDLPEEGTGEIRTVVHLKNLKDGYRSSCPQKTETITNRIVAHFLPFLIGNMCPDIAVNDDEETFSLRQIIEDHTYKPESQDVLVEGLGKFKIEHLLLSSTLVEKGTEHTVHLSAHGRVVMGHGINNQTGLGAAFEYEYDPEQEPDHVVYVGILSSTYLDQHVTQERNNFDIGKKSLGLITKAAENTAKKYLSAPIEKVIALKAETVGKVVGKFPRYGYLVKDMQDFAKDLPLNKKTEEEIYSEMSVKDFRASRGVRKEMEAMVKRGEESAESEDFVLKLSKLMERIGDQEKASLAEYVGKRKLVIDLLETRLGYEDREKKSKYTEEAVHKIICPLRVNSGEIEYGQHNLWLIDDRLAYYDYWASDKRIRDFVTNSNSLSRPDLILFQGSNLMHREGTDQPVVIVEFKRPARKDYTNDENPISQVYNYIRDLKDGKVEDNDGKLITGIEKDTPFFCYLVCDITTNLRSTMEDFKINQKLPGGRGYFGFNDARNAYVEVLQYEQIVKDAKLRHEAFFKKLGINQL